MLKSTLKKILPTPVKTALARARNSTAGLVSPVAQEVRFRRYYSRSPREEECQKIRARLTFHAHSLEKGLSHTDIRFGFGESALTQLAANMRQYRALGCDESNRAFENALSVLDAYVTLHKDNGHPTDHVTELFGTFVDEAAALKSTLGGTIPVKSADKANNRKKDFEDLFRGRVSTREYAEGPLDLALIDEAIDIALKSPSVCNRQSSRVRVLTDPDEVDAVLKIQGGFTGYDTPPALLVITSDIRDFIALTERNQGYVDGGLFSMSLLLALEYVGLAACPLNTMFSYGSDKATRKLLGVEHEDFIMFIAVGPFAPEVAAPKSFRYTLEDITL